MPNKQPRSAEFWPFVFCHVSLPSFASSVACRETEAGTTAARTYGLSDWAKLTKAKRKSASYAAAPTHSSVRGCTSTMAAAPCKPAPPLAPCRRRTSHVSLYCHRRRPTAAAAARGAQLAFPRRRRASRARLTEESARWQHLGRRPPETPKRARVRRRRLTFDTQRRPFPSY